MPSGTPTTKGMTLNGKTIPELAKEFGIRAGTIRDRIRRGKSLQEAISTQKYSFVSACRYCKESFEHKGHSTFACNKCKNEKVKCLCGCGILVRIRNPYGSEYYEGKNYAKGHDPKTKAALSAAIARRAQSKPYTCECKYCQSEFQASYSHCKICDNCKRPRKCACGECNRLVHVPGKQYANGCHPNQHSEELRARVIKMNTGRKFSKATIAKISATLRSPEGRAKVSLACKIQFNKQSKPEMILHEALDNRIFKYAGLNTKKDYGQPISADIIAPSVKLIVQVDGCWWHACPKHYNGTKQHFKRIHERDSILTKKARSEGWIVLRIWEHDINNNLDKVVTKIEKVYQKLVDNRKAA